MMEGFKRKSEADLFKDIYRRNIRSHPSDERTHNERTLDELAYIIGSNEQVHGALEFNVQGGSWIVQGVNTFTKEGQEYTRKLDQAFDLKDHVDSYKEKGGDIHNISDEDLKNKINSKDRVFIGYGNENLVQISVFPNDMYSVERTGDEETIKETLNKEEMPDHILSVIDDRIQEAENEAFEKMVEYAANNEEYDINLNELYKEGENGKIVYNEKAFDQLVEDGIIKREYPDYPNKIGTIIDKNGDIYKVNYDAQVAINGINVKKNQLNSAFEQIARTGNFEPTTFERAYESAKERAWSSLSYKLTSMGTEFAIKGVMYPKKNMDVGEQLMGKILKNFQQALDRGTQIR